MAARLLIPKAAKTVFHPPSPASGSFLSAAAISECLRGLHSLVSQRLQPHGLGGTRPALSRSMVAGTVPTPDLDEAVSSALDVDTRVPTAASQLVEIERMPNLARAAWSQARRLATTIPGSLSISPKNGVLRDPWANKHGFPFINCKRFSTLESQANEGQIPPELLTSQTVLTPDRVIGQYADLVTRVTNFHDEDKGYMVLAGDVFDVPIRKDIVHRVVRWQLAKRQQGTHSTKTISEVSGTGKKPYKQKGTGRARHGTLRGPQFRHGATMHGPKPRSHAIKLQKKVRRLGLKVALSARTAEGKLLVFEDLALPSHKTKNIVNYVSQLENTKNVLLVDGGPIDDKLRLATRNLRYVNVLPLIGLNVYSILQHETLVMTRDAVNRIVERMHTPINR